MEVRLRNFLPPSSPCGKNRGKQAKSAKKLRLNKTMFFYSAYFINQN